MCVLGCVQGVCGTLCVGGRVWAQEDTSVQSSGAVMGKEISPRSPVFQGFPISPVFLLSAMLPGGA